MAEEMNMEKMERGRIEFADHNATAERHVVNNFNAQPPQSETTLKAILAALERIETLLIAAQARTVTYEGAVKTQDYWTKLRAEMVKQTESALR